MLAKCIKDRLKYIVCEVICLLLITSSPSFSQQKTFKPKSENKALIFSVLGTVAPITVGIVILAEDEPVYGYSPSGFYPPKRDPDRTLPLSLIIGGIVAGPSLGYLYGAPKLSNFDGFLIRGALMTENILVWNSISTDNASDLWGAVIFMQFMATIISTGAVVVLAVKDITQAKEAVREHNRKLLFKNSWNITPKYFAESQALGLGIEMKF